MFSDSDLRLICPHCSARFVVRPEPEQTAVRCPNPSCSKSIELDAQREGPDDFSLWLCRKFWPLGAAVLGAVVLGAVRGC